MPSGICDVDMGVKFRSGVRRETRRITPAKFFAKSAVAPIKIERTGNNSLNHRRESVMRTYEFALILEDLPEITDEVADRLYEAGCDDSTPVSRDGIVRLEFDREAGTLEEAIQSAIDDVISAGYRVSRVESDESQTIARVNQRLTTVQ
jgi:hypothetical protein